MIIILGCWWIEGIYKGIIIKLRTQFYIFVYMESILIRPQNAEQLKTVKAVLKALRVQFETQSDNLPPHVLAGIEKSLNQYENGETISLEEFKNRHFTKR